MKKILANNKDFISKLMTLAIPIILQSLVASSLNLVDNVMIGQLGEVSISAVGLGNQVYFLANLFMMGVCGGSSIFFAQFWGKRDIDNIHKSLGMGVMLTLSIATVFTLVAMIFPSFVIGIYSKDTAVIEEGAKYLAIAALSYIPYAFSSIFIAGLRSTGNVKLPLLVSIIALGTNTLLNYGLIFGNFGFPEMGVRGAAIATTIARSIEAILIISIIYARKHALAAKLSELFSFDWQFFKEKIQKISMVIANEGFWAIGTTVYTIIYARLGTNILAAMNISMTMFNLLFIFAIGIGSAIAIMIGNSLGADKFEKAKEYGKKGIITSFTTGIMVALILLAIRGGILSLYSVGDDVLAYAKSLTTIIMIMFPITCIEFTIFIGILRAGGDTKFCTLVDIGALWLVGLPMALLGAFVFHLPVAIVYLMSKTESITRVILVFRRFMSNKWVKNVT